jgi:hypothetical protein
MRITIDHRDDPADFTATGRNYYIDCDILFSEEEQAIIRTRGLNHFSITTNTDVPMPTFVQGVTADIAKGAGGILLPLSIIIGLASSVFRAPYDNLAFLMFFAGAALWLYGLKRIREISKWELERKITLAHLLDNPKLRIWAQDPPWSKALEDQLRSDLIGLKARIMASVDLGKKETIEI